jgi:hypothetical protein
MLVVSDAQGWFSWSFQIAVDGSLKNGEPFYRLETPKAGWNSGVGAVVEDSIGQVYFATPMGCRCVRRMGGGVQSTGAWWGVECCVCREKDGLDVCGGGWEAVSEAGEDYRSSGGCAGEAAEAFAVREQAKWQHRPTQ